MHLICEIALHKFNEQVSIETYISFVNLLFSLTN